MRQIPSFCLAPAVSRVRIAAFPLAIVEKLRLAGGEVWRVRVLEFVLERRRFYSTVVNATLIVKNRVFP